MNMSVLLRRIQPQLVKDLCYGQSYGTGEVFPSIFFKIKGKDTNNVKL